MRQKPDKPVGILYRRAGARPFDHVRYLPAPALCDVVEHYWWVIQRARLHEAAERLVAGKATGGPQLALDLGYYDQSHFIRDFKALVGTSPGEYARQSQVLSGVGEWADGRLEALCTALACPAAHRLPSLL